MLDIWEGGLDSGSSCSALGREDGIVGLHVGHSEGGWDSGSSCWALGREAWIVDLHVGRGWASGSWC